MLSHFLMATMLALLAGDAAPKLQAVRLSTDGKGFVMVPSGKRFTPWGHNYGGGHIEDSGEKDWARIARDFDDFHRLGGNVARVQLQVPLFMNGPRKINQQSLQWLAKLLDLAQRKAIYLDVTGLASYQMKHRAAWYDALADHERWAAQAWFWKTIAQTCAGSPAVFCYDLINEPVAIGESKNGWYFGRMGDYEFCNYLSLDPRDRSRDQIAKEWTRTMVSAIRKHDKNHLITIGMLSDWGVNAREVGTELDFIAVHIYPVQNKVAAAIETLKRFDIGKPIVVEETFPLTCSPDDLRQFLLQSRGIAAGWLGQYPAETWQQLEDLRRAGKLGAGQRTYLAWLDLFGKLTSHRLVCKIFDLPRK